MNFYEFMKLYVNSPNIKDVASTFDFDPSYMSYRKFVQGFHLAYRLGLCKDDVVDFKKKFKVDIDTRIDAAREGLSYTDWCCKHDPWSSWYLDFWAEAADKKINVSDVIPKIMEHMEEVTEKMRDKSYVPTDERYVTDSGVTISNATRITADDLKKYRMPGLSSDFVDTDEQEVFSW